MHEIVDEVGSIYIQKLQAVRCRGYGGTRMEMSLLLDRSSIPKLPKTCHLSSKEKLHRASLHPVPPFLDN